LDACLQEARAGGTDSSATVVTAPVRRPRAARPRRPRRASRGPLLVALVALVALAVIAVAAIALHGNNSLPPGSSSADSGGRPGSGTAVALSGSTGVGPDGGATRDRPAP